MLYAVVSDNAETLKVLDENGNEVEFTLLDEDAQKAYGLKSAEELLKQFRSGNLKNMSKLFQGFAKDMSDCFVAIAGGNLKNMSKLFQGFAKDTADCFVAIAEGEFNFSTLPQDSTMLLLKLNIEGELGQERTFQIFTVDAEGNISEESQSVTITIA